jgi:RimJ/RimL family protein N-acetyltransferase
MHAIEPDGTSQALPVFETERLLVRPRSMADFAACLAMDRDPLVTQYVQGPWNDPEKHERFLRDRIETSFGPGLGYWSIVPRQNPDQFLGWILLIPFDGVGPGIEIGWRLNRQAWGKGYATEAARPVLTHGFLTLGIDRIVADIDPANAASMRVSEKIGLMLTDEGDDHGQPRACYALDKSEFVRRLDQND